MTGQLETNVTYLGNGKKNIRAYYKGNICEIARFEHVAVQNASKYQQIITDLKLVIAQAKISLKIRKSLDTVARRTSELDINNEDQITCLGLYNSCVTTYGKCFSDADKRKVKIDRDDLNGRVDDSLLKEHIKILDLRNQWTAHSGENNKECSISIVAFYEKSPGLHVAVPAHIGVLDPMPSISDLESIIKLSDTVIRLVQERVIKMEEKFEKKYNVTEIYSSFKRYQYIEF